MVQAASIAVPQARVLALGNRPTSHVDVPQARVLAVGRQMADIQVPQARVLAVVRGRIENRRIRAWPLSLDGHDLYLLQLGETETLVYDLATGQWATWNSPGRDFLRAGHGVNWTSIGTDVLNTYGARANIVAGDDTYGTLWLIDPEQPYDESPVDGGEQAFERVATGGVPMRMRGSARCNEVYLSASKGSPGLTVTAPVVSLRTSDDAERTWTEQGEITVAVGEWDQELVWRSLGLIVAPGRIFEVGDNCLARLDGLEMR